VCNDTKRIKRCQAIIASFNQLRECAVQFHFYSGKKEVRMAVLMRQSGHTLVTNSASSGVRPAAILLRDYPKPSLTVCTAEEFLAQRAGTDLQE